jgi:hypothetical protein
MRRCCLEKTISSWMNNQALRPDDDGKRIPILIKGE